jgi:hypothetical protein
MSRNALIGIAGVHYVVSELSRRGIVALPTTKNVAAYDIVAMNQEGTWHANIQVKASKNRVPFFPMPPADKVRAGSKDFYVFVRWLETDERYQGFLLTGKQAKEAVEESCSRQQVSISKGTRAKHFPTVHVGAPLNEKAKRWEKAWKSWRQVP